MRAFLLTEVTTVAKTLTKDICVHHFVYLKCTACMLLNAAKIIYSHKKKHMYRKVFNEQYNFSYHPPSEDTCEKCDIFKAAIISGEEKEKSAIKGMYG